MEGTGALFNPGFLGGSFLWWVGQIADDSTWRENISEGKYEDKTSVPGWGRRYKVRIIGLHDQGEATIPSDQLPWAQVMYPITAGGGQTGARQTSQLRQGNMVFGFFLDGQERQVPVIMGILGNNSQTLLSQKNSTVADTVTDTQPGSIAKSGYATGSKEKSGSSLEVPPDYDKVIKQPARNSDGSEAGPGAAPAPGATFENIDSVHQIDSADVKRQEKCDEKIVVMKPDDLIGSAMKGIQTAIDNLTKKIDKYLQALQSYVDAVTNVIDDIKSLVTSFAAEIAKYMKVIYDKIMEYALKVLNEAMNKVVAALPSSLRHKLADMKEILTENLLCLYGKLTDTLSDTVASALSGSLDIDNLERQVRDLVANGEDEEGRRPGRTTLPKVPMCYAEGIASIVLSGSKTEIDQANANLVENVDAFLEDTSAMMAGVSGAFSDISLSLPDIGGSITSALSFNNITLNVFTCELDPSAAVSDYYTFCSGGDAQASSDQPSSESVSEAIDSQNAVETPEGEPFAEPPRGTPDVDNTTSGMEKPTQDLEVGESNAETRALVQEERDFIASQNNVDSTGAIQPRELSGAEQIERQEAIDSLELE